MEQIVFQMFAVSDFCRIFASESKRPRPPIGSVTSQTQRIFTRNRMRVILQILTNTISIIVVQGLNDGISRLSESE